MKWNESLGEPVLKWGGGGGGGKMITALCSAQGIQRRKSTTWEKSSLFIFLWLDWQPAWQRWRTNAKLTISVHVLWSHESLDLYPNLPIHHVSEEFLLEDVVQLGLVQKALQFFNLRIFACHSQTLETKRHVDMLYRYIDISEKKIFLAQSRAPLKRLGENTHLKHWCRATRQS